MFTVVLAALALLAIGVAAAYFLLKNMSQEGIEIAAPGSCRRSRCGPQCQTPAEQAEEAPLAIADAPDQGEPRA